MTKIKLTRLVFDDRRKTHAIIHEEFVVIPVVADTGDLADLFGAAS